MYINVIDPDTGKSLFVDIIIHNRVGIRNGEIYSKITDVFVNDVTTESELAKSIASASNAMPCEETLKRAFGVCHRTPELKWAIENEIVATSG